MRNNSKLSNVVITVTNKNKLNKSIPGFEKFGELYEATSVWGVLNTKYLKEVNSLPFVEEVILDSWGNYVQKK